ncbi:MAG: cobyrinic acid a,c-diamide synthase, partial [Methanoregulaceae archaeon]|nr:cobyrinic acid a,c-diamide synthase [Methanoregulaceae archaeon]
YLAPGSRLAGHEFHYSRMDCLPGARFSIRLRRGTGISDGRDGLHEHEVTGTYLHACFSPAFAERFVDSAEKYRRS